MSWYQIICIYVNILTHSVKKSLLCVRQPFARSFSLLLLSLSLLVLLFIFIFVWSMVVCIFRVCNGFVSCQMTSDGSDRFRFPLMRLWKMWLKTLKELRKETSDCNLFRKDGTHVCFHLYSCLCLPLTKSWNNTQEQKKKSDRDRKRKREKHTSSRWKITSLEENTEKRTTNMR